MSLHLLSIGINYSGMYQLRGCHNDVMNIKKVIYDCHPKKGICTHLLDDGKSLTPTLENIKKSIKDIYSSCLPGDTIVFSFSGHGGSIKDNNLDEKDGQDECLYDCELTQIRDDDLYKMLVDELPKNVRLRVILDCCHSGTGLDLAWQYRDFSEAELVTEKSSPKNVVCISGCKDPETSADAWIEKKAQGALTATLCDILDTKRSKKDLSNMKWTDLIKLLHYQIKKQGFDQNPVISFSALTFKDSLVDI